MATGRCKNLLQALLLQAQCCYLLVEVCLCGLGTQGDKIGTTPSIKARRKLKNSWALCLTAYTESFRLSRAGAEMKL